MEQVRRGLVLLLYGIGAYGVCAVNRKHGVRSSNACCNGVQCVPA